MYRVWLPQSIPQLSSIAIANENNGRVFLWLDYGEKVLLDIIKNFPCIWNSE